MMPAARNQAVIKIIVYFVRYNVRTIYFLLTSWYIIR
jgi:hypothetical protein